MINVVIYDPVTGNVIGSRTIIDEPDLEQAAISKMTNYLKVGSIPVNVFKRKVDLKTKTLMPDTSKKS